MNKKKGDEMMVDNYGKEYWLEEIQNTSNVIIQAIDVLKDNIGLLCSLVLPKLRVLVDSIACYIRESEDKKNIASNENSYSKIEKSISFVRKGKNDFLAKLHDEFNIPNHHTPIGEYAIRLMYSYTIELNKVKDFFFKKYNIEILKGIEDFTMDRDESFKDYYRKILELLDKCNFSERKFDGYSYYVQKKKTIYVNHDLIYEYTLTNALDQNNRFDSFIAFSKLDIFDNYAIKARMARKNIDIFDRKIDILILTDYNVSIRKCEFDHLSWVLGLNKKYSRKTIEYSQLMEYIQKKRIPLSKLVLLGEEDYHCFERECFADAMTHGLQELLFKARTIINSNENGKNVLLYLLCTMRNEIIRKQLESEPNPELNNLYLKNKCLPFEQTPYSASLCKHIPMMKYVMQCISYDEHYYEMINRIITNNSVENNELYTPIGDLEDYNNVDDVIRIYNSKIPKYHSGRIINKFNNYVYIEEHESNTKEFIKLLRPLVHNGGIENYKEYVDLNIKKIGKLDDDCKRRAIEKMFLKSTIFVIYGSAGVGKSTLADYMTNILDDYSVLCLANTNPAVENLKEKIKKDNVAFSTIYSFISDKNNITKYDLLIIDECSTISTKDIYDVFNKIDCKAIILMGDVYQIEAIKFGNWFGLIKHFLPKDSYIDLERQFRTENSVLKELWENVRELKISDVRSSLSFNKISHELDEDILVKKDNDEIILCLNYDGIFGINSVNKLLQINNDTDVVVQWKQYIFKKDDPVLFLENSRFKGVIYNNLKGRIELVKEYEESIYFRIKVETHIDPEDASDNSFSLISSNGKESVIDFIVNKYGYDSFDENSDEMNKIPFQIAYAVSIHKSQGLEYNSVKIIIPNEIDENISLNIFYTAITRAKEKLQIYWTKESEEKILHSFETKNSSKDAGILLGKYPELRLK